MNLQVTDNFVNFIEQNVKFDHVKQLDSAKSMQINKSYTISVNSNAYFSHVTGTKVHHHAITIVKRKLVAGILYAGLIAGFVAGIIAGLVAGLVSGKDLNQVVAGSLAGAVAGVFTVTVYSARGSDIGDINSVRFFAVRFFVIVLSLGVIGAVRKANSGAAIGAIGGAFVGSLIAGVANKAIKSIAKATVFAIAIGALVGTAIGAAGETVLGTISGAITAGTVAVAFDNLEAFVKTVFTTGIFGKAVKSVAGIIMAIPWISRDDMKAVIIGTFIGVIISPISSGAVIGAVAVALINRASHETMDSWIFAFLKDINPTNVLTVVTTISLFLCLNYGSIVFNEGVSGAVGGVFIAGCFGMLVAQPADNPAIAAFRHRAIFAAFAGVLGGGCATILKAPIIRSFSFGDAIPEPVVRSIITTIIIAIIGAAGGGYLLAVVVNIAGDRLVVGAVTRFTERMIQIIAVIGEIGRALARAVDQAIILGAIGAIFGAFLGLGTDELVSGRLAGTCWGGIFGAITGTAGGAVVVATTAIRSIAIPIVVKFSAKDIKAIIVISAIGGFFGGVVGGCFMSSMVTGGLIGLAFSIGTAAILIIALCIARRHHVTVIQTNLIPLMKFVNKFGTVIGLYTFQGGLNNWVQYKIAKAP